MAGSTETCGVVDTHCHLDLIMDRLGEPRESLVEWRAGLPSEQSFEACVTIGCSLSTFDTTESFLQHDFVYGAFGIHPLSAEDWTQEVESRVEALVKVASPPSLATAKLALTIVTCNPRGRASDTTHRPSKQLLKALAFSGYTGEPEGGGDRRVRAGLPLRERRRQQGAAGRCTWSLPSPCQFSRGAFACECGGG